MDLYLLANSVSLPTAPRFNSMSPSVAGSRSTVSGAPKDIAVRLRSAGMSLIPHGART
jgi:hypothetical protein